MTFSVTLCVLSFTLGAIMVFSEDGGDELFFSFLISEKFRVSWGILLIVLYLLRFESDVDPKRLDLIWLKGPKQDRKNRLSVLHVFMMRTKGVYEPQKVGPKQVIQNPYILYISLTKAAIFPVWNGLTHT